MFNADRRPTICVFILADGEIIRIRFRSKHYARQAARLANETTGIYRAAFVARS